MALEVIRTAIRTRAWAPVHPLPILLRVEIRARTLRLERELLVGRPVEPRATERVEPPVARERPGELLAERPVELGRPVYLLAPHQRPEQPVGLLAEPAGELRGPSQRVELPGDQLAARPPDEH